MSDVSDFEEGPVREENSFIKAEKSKKILNDELLFRFTDDDIEDLKKETEKNMEGISPNGKNAFDFILDEIIEPAIKKTFKWEKLKIKIANKYFSKFTVLEKSPCFQLYQFDQVPTKLRAIYFQILVEIPFKEPVGSELYRDLISLFSNVMNAFNVLFWNKYMEYKPNIKSKSLDMYDPFYRQMIRRTNLKDKQINEMFFNEEFNIKEFVLVCLKKFIPHESSFWAQFNHKAHYYSLRLFLELFEYGLWTKQECVNLNDVMFKLVGSLSIYEQFVSEQINKRKEKFREDQISKYLKGLRNCRKITGYIYLHMIALMLDDHLEGTIHQYQISDDSQSRHGLILKVKQSVDLKNLYTYPHCKNKLFYTYLGCAMSSYFYKVVYIGDKPIISGSFNDVLKKLTGFISDNSIDFYFHSLQAIDPNSLSFFRHSESNMIMVESEKLRKKFEDFIVFIETNPSKNVQNELIISFEQEFQNIIRLFLRIAENPEDNCGYQISMALNSIPKYILFLLHYLINQDLKLTKIKKTVRLGIHAVAEIVSKNATVFNTIASGVPLLHLKKSAHFDMVGGVMLFAKSLSLEHTNVFQDINYNFFSFFFNQYRRLMNEFCNIFEGNFEAIKANVTLQEVYAFINYNKLFKTYFKFKKSHNFKIEIYLTSLISSQFEKILKYFCNREIADYTQFEIDTFQAALRNTETWSDIPEFTHRLIIEEALHSSLSMFQQSTRRFHNEQVYNTYIKHFMNECKLQYFFGLLKTKRGIRIFRCVCNLFKTFMVFHNNTTFLTEDFNEPYKKVKVQTAFSTEELRFEVVNQLKALFDRLEQNDSSIEKEQVESLLISNYFPLILKLVCGLLCIVDDKMYMQIDVEIYNKIFEFFKGQDFYISEFQHRTKQKYTVSDPNKHLIEFIQELSKEKNDYFYKKTYNNKIDNARIMFKSIIMNTLNLYTFFPKKWWQIEEMIRYIHGRNYKEFTHKINKKLEFNIKHRQNKNLENDKRVRWHKFEEEMKKELLLENFDDQRIAKLRRIEFKSVWLFSYRQAFKEESENNESLPVQEKEHDVFSTPRKAVFFMQKCYRQYKGYLIDNIGKNKILYLLCIQDEHSPNARLLVDFFLFKLSSMDLGFEKPRRNFLADHFYLQLIFLVDNMMNLSDTFREQFFLVLNEPLNKHAFSNCIEKLWALNRILFTYLVYKTFRDDTWMSIYQNFYVVNSFIQNLCENNYLNFKQWFGGNKIKPCEEALALEEYHYYIENSILQTETWSSKDSNLNIRDREEIFPVLCKAIECLTEFINGGDANGDTLIYSMRMDIFSGVVFRVVDNLDSNFYALKENIIIYVCALVERMDPEIVEFVARHFSVAKIFKHIRKLIKKLFVRQYFLLSPSAGHKLGWENEESPITSHMTNQHRLSNHLVLLDYYKLYDDSFAEHKIIGICIRLFDLLNRLSLQISRFHYFAEELEKSAKRIHELKYTNNSVLLQKESAIVWAFLTRITVKIEIERHLECKDSTADEKNWSLQTYIFQKKPVSFFINFEMKKEFMKDVKISSLNEKHDDFFNIIDHYDEILEYQRGLYIKNKYIYIFLNDSAFIIFRYFLLIISVIMNILLFVYYNGSTQNYKRFMLGDGRSGILTLTIVGVVYSSLMIITWLSTKYILKCKDAIHMYGKLKIKKSNYTIGQTLYVYVYHGLLRQSEFMYDMMYILSFLLGWFVNPVFYAFSLFMIIELSEVVKGVVMCFVNNGQKLFLAIVLIALIINFYSYILADQFISYLALTPETANMCNSYFRCFMNTFNIGTFKDQGIAQVMIHVPKASDTHFVGRFFFDITFYFTVQVLMFAIYFGIVIDSFEEFKQEEKKREEDQRTICFVCGLHREAFERNSLRFVDHLKFHNIWNYFYYAQYLKRFPKNDYNGTDIYVSDLLAKRQLIWLPKGKTEEIELKKRI